MDIQAGEEGNQLQELPLPLPPPQAAVGEVGRDESMMAVVSGESDGGDLSDEDVILSSSSSAAAVNNKSRNGGGFESTDDENDSNSDDDIQQATAGGDLLYDENMDDEDEAYVYKNLRGGARQENKDVSADLTESGAASKRQKDIVVASSSTAESTTTTTAQPTAATTTGAAGTATPVTPVTKPRNSDAVLSCPCCFNIVCMDCQRHERYANQFRAMFVMGIEVDWEHRLIHNGQALVRYELPSPIQTADNATSSSSTVTTSCSSIVAPDCQQFKKKNSMAGVTFADSHPEYYYAVSCASCHTMVAALDMADEVYHFYDCLASA